jgi:hypothetical protein
MPLRFLKSLTGAFHRAPTPAEVLATLRRSAIFQEDYPRRQRITHRQFAELSEEQLQDFWSIPVRAVRLTPNSLELRFMASGLGEARYLPAIPTLIELWQNCPLLPLREGVGWGLWEFGTHECLQTLIDTLEEHDCDYMAIAAIFTRDKMTSFDALSKYFDPDLMSLPGGGVIPNGVLRNFLPHETSERKLVWSDAVVGDLLFRDPRWFDLVKRMREHPVTEYTANWVLQYVDHATDK